LIEVPKSNSIRRKARLAPSDRREFFQMIEDDSQPPPSPGSAADRPGTVRETERRNTWIAIEVVVERPCWLVVGDYWDPGWRATIHNRVTEEVAGAAVERFAGVFRGLELNRPGRYRVEFQYSTPGIRLGGWLSGFSVALLAWLWFFRPNA
jgi:hypothetical protein